MLILPGCSSSPKTPPKPPTRPVLTLKHQLGGTHYRGVLHQGVWYQTFGCSLVLLDPSLGAVMREVELGEPGKIGPATDMLISGDRLFVVIQDDEVIELSIATPRAPTIAHRWSRQMLGIQPRRLSLVDGIVHVAGPGGVVRLSDGAKLYECADDPQSVARTDYGLVTTINRRVFRLEDGRYVGSASQLHPLPLSLGIPGGLVFVRQGQQGALVGLMSPDIREINTETATVAVNGQVRSVRVMGGRLWVISDQEVNAYRVSSDALESTYRLAVVGAHDAVLLTENHLAIVGSCGRLVMRLDDGGRDPERAVVRAHHEPAGLTAAVSDGQYILAGGPNGYWMYLINSRVEPAEPVLKAMPAPITHAAVAAGRAEISDDGAFVKITAGQSEWLHREPLDATIHCVAAVDGNFWIGHDRGITVLRPEGRQAVPVKNSRRRSGGEESVEIIEAEIGRLRLEGPVRYIYPLLIGGGASFVSDNGGFGVAVIVNEPIAPQAR